MRKRTFTALALAGSLALAPYAFAQQRDQQKQDQRAYDQQQRQEQSQQQRDSTTRQQQAQSGQQQSQYAQNLLTADNLKGMQIRDQQGQELGSVDQLIVDAEQGQLAYIVVSTGGFWGIGGDKAVVPWKALQLQSQQTMQQGETAQRTDQQQQQQAQEGEQILVLNVQKEQLKNAPEGDLQNVLDRQQGTEIHRFYGVAPYWESGQQSSQEQMKQQKDQGNLPPGHKSKEERGQGEPPGHQPKEEGGR